MGLAVFIIAYMYNVSCFIADDRGHCSTLNTVESIGIVISH